MARFCPRCGIATRRRAGQPIALVLLLAGTLIVLSNLTMRALTVGNTTATLYVPRSPSSAAPPARIEPAATAYDIESNPLVLLDRDVSAREMRLHGVRLGDAQLRIPRRFITRTATNEMHCYDGNVYACRDDAITAVVLNDPAILLRIPCAECLSVFNRFGVPDALEDAEHPDGDRLRFTYAARGMSVRWNRRTSRIDQIILMNPR